LDTKLLKRMLIWLPGLDEQEAVAGAIDGIERSILCAQDLVAKKQAIRQGVVQQLLTGRSRIPGHCSSWARLPISEIANFSSGDSINVSRLSGRSTVNPIPVFGGNGIAGYTSSANIARPTVVIGRVGQKCGNVYKNSGPVWITDNAIYARQFKRPVDVQFFALALEASNLNEVRNSNDLPLITQAVLNSVMIPWPESVAEQRFIADTISGIGEEITGLRRLIAKRWDIRKGMMQQLLTGRTRLPVLGGTA